MRRWPRDPCQSAQHLVAVWKHPIPSFRFLLSPNIGFHPTQSGSFQDLSDVLTELIQ